MKYVRNMSANAYEVRVVVPSLEEGSKLLALLGERGYRQVSMGSPSQQTQALNSPQKFDIAKANLNKLNNWILISLYKVRATEKANRVTAEKIVAGLQTLPETKNLFIARSEGVVSRTVSMVASAVLGDKLSWVAYEKEKPRRFWLNQEGKKQAELLLGEETK